MIERTLMNALATSLSNFPVVAILGPRQVGKTTLALALKNMVREKPVVYVDPERPSDRVKLEEPELFLGDQAGRLVILDGIQRLPQVFPLLRSLVDERRRAGERASQFLLLGSASPELLRQSAESLAGRISYHELKPFSVLEVEDGGIDSVIDRLWLRGGFPDSFLALSDPTSLDWRDHFISTYLERDIPQFAPRIATETLRRFWTMLAHGQGSLRNASKLASGLGVTSKTVSGYLEMLCDLFLVRQLKPWFRNVRKRLVKSPKVYVRDSGLVHALAGIKDKQTLLGHPLCGPSWEGFVLENLLAVSPPSWRSFFFRTVAGAEVDLILETGDGRTLAIEIKRTLQPKLEKGFVLACQDIGADEKYVVIPGGATFALGNDTTAIPFAQMLQKLALG